MMADITAMQLVVLAALGLVAATGSAFAAGGSVRVHSGAGVVAAGAAVAPGARAACATGWLPMIWAACLPAGQRKPWARPDRYPGTGAPRDQARGSDTVWARPPPGRFDSVTKPPKR